MMDREFINTFFDMIEDCRKAGLKIALSEVTDFLEAVKIIPAHELNIHTAMKAALIKNVSNNYVFDLLYEFYFDNPGYTYNYEKSTPQDLDIAIGSDCGSGSGIGSGRAGSMVGDWKVIRQKILSADIIEQRAYIVHLISKLYAEQRILPQSRRENINRLMLAMGYKEAIFRIRESLVEDIPKNMVAEEKIEKFQHLLQMELDLFTLRNLSRDEASVFLHDKQIGAADFETVNSEEASQIVKQIKRIAKNIANKYAYGYKPSFRGRLDISRILRNNLGTKGVPFRLKHESRKQEKLSLMVLCDLSGSIAPYAQFILYFVYLLQYSLKNLSIVAFIDTVDEISSYLKSSYDINKVFKEIQKRAKISNTGFSHYGQVAIDFEAQFGAKISKDTTLLIIGDCRTNYQKVYPEVWSKILGRCKQPFWLNPRPKELWATEDCQAISTFQPLVKKMFECRSLYQLEEVAREIF